MLSAMEVQRISGFGSIKKEDLFVVDFFTQKKKECGVFSIRFTSVRLRMLVRSRHGHEHDSAPPPPPKKKPHKNTETQQRG